MVRKSNFWTNIITSSRIPEFRIRHNSVKKTVTHCLIGQQTIYTKGLKLKTKLCRPRWEGKSLSRSRDGLEKQVKGQPFYIILQSQRQGRSKAVAVEAVEAVAYGASLQGAQKLRIKIIYLLIMLYLTLLILSKILN